MRFSLKRHDRERGVITPINIGHTESDSMAPQLEKYGMNSKQKEDLDYICRQVMILKDRYICVHD